MLVFFGVTGEIKRCWGRSGTTGEMVPNSPCVFLALFWTSGLSLWVSYLICLLAHCLVSKKVCLVPVRLSPRSLWSIDFSDIS